MRKRLDPQYTKISLYVFGTAAAIILFWRLLDSSTDLWQSFVTAIRFLLKMLAPFLFALALAYILSPAAALLERLLGKIWRRDSQKNRVRIASIAAIYIVLIGLLAIGVYYILPGVVRNIMDLVGNMPEYIKQANSLYLELIKKEPFCYFEIQNIVNDALNKLKVFLTDWAPNVVYGLPQSIKSVIGGVVNAVLGIVLSIYLLLERSNIGKSCTRMLTALLGEDKTRHVTSLLAAMDRVFGRYISARLLESLIVFVLTQIAFLIIGVRYSVLMSAIVAVTNLVPYVGPILGGVFPVVVTLLDNPIRALIVLGVLLVIQSIDAYVVSPKLTGDRLGMSPFWVLLVIILGGGFFGMWGILLAVPVAAVIRLMISQYIRGRAIRHQKADEQGRGSSHE